jgi:hypothetical protein
MERERYVKHMCENEEVCAKPVTVMPSNQLNSLLIVRRCHSGRTHVKAEKRHQTHRHLILISYLHRLFVRSGQKKE